MNQAEKLFISLSKKYRTPKQVQLFLKNFPYNAEKNGETARSAYQALKHGTAHCLEAAFIAAAILEHKGYPPLFVSIESMDGLGHVLFVFRKNGKWGSIGRSRDEGLHGREPIFRSIRDLVWSYYDPYVDLTCKITEYALVNMNECEADWHTSKKNVWKAEKFLVDLKHTPLRSSKRRYKKLLDSYKKNGPMAREKFWW